MKPELEEVSTVVMLFLSSIVIVIRLIGMFSKKIEKVEGLLVEGDISVLF